MNLKKWLKKRKEKKEKLVTCLVCKKEKRSEQVPKFTFKKRFIGKICLSCQMTFYKVVELIKET